MAKILSLDELWAHADNLCRAITGMTLDGLAAAAREGRPLHRSAPDLLAIRSFVYDCRARIQKRRPAVTDLIAALTIFAKYIPDKKYPTTCEHDELYVHCNPDIVSDDDVRELRGLGFYRSEVGNFVSTRFGSA